MIQTIQDLKDYLRTDFKNNHEIYKKNILKEYLKGNIKTYYKFKYLYCLRIFEYCTNNKQGVLGKLRYLVFKRMFQKLQVKTQLFISPNTCEAGLNIEHLGYIWVDSSSHLGKNNVLLPRLLFGKKSPSIVTPPNENRYLISTGDNVYVGTGSTILGPVNIGSNVIIAAGSVVVKDIPNNSIVAGVPAMVIKNVEPNMLQEYFPYLKRQ